MSVSGISPMQVQVMPRFVVIGVIKIFPYRSLNLFITHDSEMNTWQYMKKNI